MVLRLVQVFNMNVIHEYRGKGSSCMKRERSDLVSNIKLTCEGFCCSDREPVNTLLRSYPDVCKVMYLPMRGN